MGLTFDSNLTRTMEESNPAIIDTVLDYLAIYGMKIVAALVILIIGLWIAKKLKGLLGTVLTKRDLDPTLVAFLSSLSYTGLVVLVVVAAISKLGVETTSFAAVVASAGLAIGLALQGSLSNFAAGVLLILFKPFKAGDLIEAAGHLGSVKEIGLLTTELATLDNRQVIAPNSTVLGAPIVNLTGYDKRRVDMVVGVSYGDDLDKVEDIIEAVIAEDDRILKDPAPQVAVSTLNNSSVDFVVRPWCAPADYWGVNFDFMKKVKQRFDAEGVTIPFPQRDVHLYQDSSGN